MKYAIALLSLFIATYSFADNAELHCWSGHYTIFKKTIQDLFPSDGYVVAVDKHNTYMITGDCVLTYKNRPHHKHKKAKK